MAKERQKELRREAEDEIRLTFKDIPKITFSLVLANIFVFAFFSLRSSNSESIIVQWGFTPNNLAQLNSLPTLFTHMFLHANFLHIFLNMLIFVQFGYLCERKIGMSRFTLLYFMCGIFAVLFHAFFNLRSEIPCVGASGAIFGVLASCALLYPGRPLYLRVKYTRKKVPLIIGVFFVFLLETVYAFAGINPYIAHTAHLGGGIAGVFMTAILFPRETLQILSDLIDAMIPVVPEQTADSRERQPS